MLRTAMAAQFTEITLEEVEKFLKRSFRAMRPKQAVDGGEVVFILGLGHYVGIKVLTSIRARSGIGAERGSDAIRVGLISLKDGNALEGGKFAIAKRTQNWRDSLKDRIEECMETYHEKPESWEQWATSPKRRPGKSLEWAMREQEQEEKQEQRREEKLEQERLEEERERAIDEDGEGDEGPRTPTPPPPPPVAPTRQYDPARMQGGITDPQMNFLRILMRGMTQDKWEATGAAKVTGMDTPPTKPSEVRGLSKSQASMLIDALKAGSSRYAAEFEEYTLHASYDLRGA
jgi:hypothetical protein